MIKTKKVLQFLSGMLGISYPLTVYFLLQYKLFIWLIVCLLFLALVRLIVAKRQTLMVNIIIASLLLAMVLLYNLTSSEQFLLYYPLIVNVVFFCSFYQSLLKVPIVEQFAAIYTPKDRQDKSFKVYCRNVTKAWCYFFIVNGTISLITVIYADKWLWMVYNGIIAYILIALMFVTEYAVRRLVMSNYIYHNRKE